MLISSIDQMRALCAAAAPVGSFTVVGSDGRAWSCGQNVHLAALPGPAVVWGTNPDVGQVRLWIEQETFPDGHVEPQPTLPIALPAELIHTSAPVPGFEI